MPRQYEDIKRSELKAGRSPKVAKRIAAATWNKLHPNDTNPWAHESGFASKVRRGMRKRRR